MSLAAFCIGWRVLNKCTLAAQKLAAAKAKVETEKAASGAFVMPEGLSRKEQKKLLADQKRARHKATLKHKKAKIAERRRRYKDRKAARERGDAGESSGAPSSRRLAGAVSAGKCRQAACARCCLPSYRCEDRTRKEARPGLALERSLPHAEQVHVQVDTDCARLLLVHCSGSQYAASQVARTRVPQSRVQQAARQPLPLGVTRQWRRRVPVWQPGMCSGCTPPWCRRWLGRASQRPRPSRRLASCPPSTGAVTSSALPRRCGYFLNSNLHKPQCVHACLLRAGQGFLALQ